MAKAPSGWTYRLAKPKAPVMPAQLKDMVQAQAQDLIDTVLAPRIPPPPLDPQFNYLVGISTMRWRQYFYFVSTYHVSGPAAAVPAFDAKFARLEYVGSDRFNLAFMRHTGQWIDLYQRVTLAQCLASIVEDSFFTP